LCDTRHRRLSRRVGRRHSILRVLCQGSGQGVRQVRSYLRERTSGLRIRFLRGHTGQPASVDGSHGSHRSCSRGCSRQLNKMGQAGNAVRRCRHRHREQQGDNRSRGHGHPPLRPPTACTSEESPHQLEQDLHQSPGQQPKAERQQRPHRQLQCRIELERQRVANRPGHHELLPQHPAALDDAI